MREEAGQAEMPAPSLEMLFPGGNALVERLVGIGFWARWAEGATFALSPEARRIYGFPEDAALVSQTDLLARLAPADRRGWEARRRTPLAEGARRVTSYRVQRPEGGLRWVRVCAASVRHGERTVVCGTVEDVTAAVELRQREERHRRLLDEICAIARIGLWRRRADQATVEWSDDMFRILGYEPHSFAPTTDFFQDLIHPTDMKRYQAARDRLLTSREPVLFDLQVRHADGGWRWLRNTARIERDGSGVDWVVGVVQDITELARSQRQLHRQQLLLEEAQKEFGLALWHYSCAERSFVVSSPHAAALGLPVGDAPVPLETLRAYWHPDDAPAILEALEQVARTGRSTTIVYRIVAADGSVRHRASTMMAERNLDGDIVGVQGLSLDVTAAAEQRRRLETAERLASIGRLVGGVAHDFNNLLGIVSLNLELASDHAQERAELEFLREAQRAVERASVLTKGLLTFAQRQPLEPRAVRVRDAFEEVSALTRRLLGGRITLRLDDVDDALWVRVDPTQLENALVNLIVNARDAMPEGGTIALEARPVDDATAPDMVALSVRDTGHGMPPEVAERAIEPFFTTKKETGGTGLGLSMVYGFVRQHGGDLRIESRPQAGTAVTMVLPRAAPPGNPRGERADGEPAPRRRLPLRILIVDDEPDLRLVLKRLCQRCGMSVAVAAGAEEALRVLAEEGERIDVVLTDIRMPGSLDGLGLARELAATRPSLPVVLMTGFDDQAAGDVPWPMLRKPFREAALLALLDTLRPRSAADGAAAPPSA